MVDNANLRWRDMINVRLADLPVMTPERILELKAEAKVLKEATGGKHMAVLAQLAQREGFLSWERLCAKAGGRDAVDDVRRAMPNERAEARAARQADRHARYGEGK